MPWAMRIINHTYRISEIIEATPLKIQQQQQQQQQSQHLDPNLQAMFNPHPQTK